MKIKVAFIYTLLFATIIHSCKKDDTTCDNANVSYEGQIKNLFASCAIVGCHNAGSLEGSLANYQDAKTFPKMTRMLGALRGQVGFLPMPQGGTKLNECDISKIEKWINLGFPQ